MKTELYTKIALTLVILLLLANLLASLPTPSQAAGPVQYKLVPDPPGDSQAYLSALNQSGAQGWEYVDTKGFRDGNYLLFVKK